MPSGVPTKTGDVFTVEIIGTQQLSQALRYLNKTLQRRFHQALTRAVREIVVPQIRAITPKGPSGALARVVRVTYSHSKGLRIKIGRRGHGDYKNAYYASWVIYGSPSPIYRYGRTPIGKARIGKRRGIQRRNPYPYRVLDRTWPLVRQRVQLTINHFQVEFTKRLNNRKLIGNIGGGSMRGPELPT